MKKEIVNVEGLVFGRVASIVAEKLLQGYDIEIYNVEKLVITGNLKNMMSKYKERLNYKAKSNPKKGPKYSRMPHLMLRKAIKNMLPHKKARGQEAFHHLKIHIGMPEKIKAIKYKEAEVKQGLKYKTLGEVSKLLGAKW